MSAPPDTGGALGPFTWLRKRGCENVAAKTWLRKRGAEVIASVGSTSTVSAMPDGPLDGRFLVVAEDGHSSPHARYFAIDYAQDPHAGAALAAYADACESTQPTLAADLRAVVAYHQQRRRRT